VALILDLKSDRWRALNRFIELLYNLLNDNLVSIIALPEDTITIYDSNVLVVVERLDRDVSLKVAEAALKVNEQFKSTISYMITTKEDGETIEKFKKAVYTLEDWDDYDEAIDKFKKILIDQLNHNLIEILTLPKKQFLYDSNVLVVVERLDRDVSLKVAEAALKVNEQFKSTISYMITTKEDGETIEKFKKIRNTPT
jgi:tetratricopeptide (TPR) repeat protein